MQKKIPALSALLCLSTFALPAYSAALGVIVGEPTGLSYKQWLDNGDSVTAAAAWSFDENESLQLHVNYLFNTGTLNTPEELQGSSQWYVGLGARLKLEEDDDNGRNRDDDLLGLRLPIGINFYPAKLPIEVFGELVPVLDLVPDSDFDINAAIGVRYIFSRD